MTPSELTMWILRQNQKVAAEIEQRIAHEMDMAELRGKKEMIDALAEQVKPEPKDTAQIPMKFESDSERIAAIWAPGWEPDDE